MMKHPISSAALFGLATAVLAAPAQAQDPATAYKQIEALTEQGSVADALALCDKTINTLTTSRAGKQFAYMMPFFLWQKGNLQASSKDYSAAFATFKDLHENPVYRSKEAMDAAKNHRTGSIEPTIRTFLSASLFQMGYMRFQEAVEKDNALFTEATGYLETYLKNVRDNKVTAEERAQKMDGKICFLLLQSCILQPKPDFKKAAEYLKLSKESKSPIPDDMAIGGLDSIISVAVKDPQYIEWVHTIISSSPASYDLGPLRTSRYAGKFFQHAQASANIVDTLVKENKMPEAYKAAQSAFALFGLVPDTGEALNAFKEQQAAIGKATMVIPDRSWGARYVPDVQKKALEDLEKWKKDNFSLDGLAVLFSSDMSFKMGSMRLAKAGFQLLNDRYPQLSSYEGEEVKSLRKINLLQLAQLTRITGDAEGARKLNKAMVEEGIVDDSNKNTVLYNNMIAAQEEEKWDELITAAEEFMKAAEADKSDPQYLTAEFLRIVAFLKLQRYQDIVTAAEAFLGSGNLKGELAANYEPQTLYFLQEAHVRLSPDDAAHLDSAIKCGYDYREKFPETNLDVNIMASRVCFNMIESLLKRRGHGDEVKSAEDVEKALEFCRIFAETWPNDALFPNAQLLAGHTYITSDAPEPKEGEEAPAINRKVEGVKALEACYDKAINPTEGDVLKPIASTALYWLASYSPTIDMPGEDAAARDARIKGYFEAFWTKVDEAGDNNCLDMANLALTRATKENDEAVVTAAREKLISLIGRESKQCAETGKAHPSMEKVINSFSTNYFNYMQQSGKAVSLDDKINFYVNFPGLDPKDKMTAATLRMALIDTLTEGLAAIPVDQTGERAKLQERIDESMNDMNRAFTPAQLTNYQCVRLGDFLVNYIRSFEAGTRENERTRAIAYYDKAINDAIPDYAEQARVGRANAMALSANDADRNQAISVYEQIASSGNPDAAAPALKGLTNLYMSNGKYKQAINTASQYVKLSTPLGERLNMMMTLGEAYAKDGQIEFAIATYSNISNQNRGQVEFSAPATKAIMELFWERNRAAKGEYLRSDHSFSDRWTAWTAGAEFVRLIEPLEGRLSAKARDAFLQVRSLTQQYGADRKVQAEDRNKRDLDSKVSSGK